MNKTKKKSRQYQIGDILSDKYQLISRDYKQSNGNWVCTFKCLVCGESFQTRLNRLNERKTILCKCVKPLKSDLLGKTKGVYTIIKDLPPKPPKRDAYWLCRCDVCGSEFEITTTNFNRHEHKVCPHGENVSGAGRPPSLKIGDIFDQLIIISYLGDQHWKCQCRCGKECIKVTWQLTSNEYNSCPECSNISNGEQKLIDLFQKMDIQYEYQKSFDSCRFPNTNSLARFDFYLPDFDILIEYNGIQHYEYRENSKSWNTKENYDKTLYRDNYKQQWCQENNKVLVVIPYTDYNQLDANYIQKIINNNEFII